VLVRAAPAVRAGRLDPGGVGGVLLVIGGAVAHREQVVAWPSPVSASSSKVTARWAGLDDEPDGLTCLAEVVPPAGKASLLPQ